MPIRPTISPDKATEASRSRTLRAITGNIAPFPVPKRSDGPNAGMAIFLKLNEVSLIGCCVSASANAGRVDGKIPNLGSRREGCHCVTRSEEHTSELQSLMCISYAVFCL